MRPPENAGEAHREVTGSGYVLRDPLPTARAILWKPLPDSYHLLASMMRTAEQHAALFVTQRAFLQVERHLRSAPDLELGGYLAGQLFECPRTHIRYSVINTVVPFADVSSNALGARVTQESFETVRVRLDGHRLSLIGWYRNGAGLGLQLLPDDVETHLAYFDQPWQTTMLVVPDPAKARGAFFTYDPRVGRSYCIPFYELFDTQAVDGNRLDRTCVSWSTYVPAEPVAPLPPAEKEVVEATIAPLRKPEPEPEPVEPIDEWWDAIKEPWVRLKDVAVSATRRDDKTSRASEPVQERPAMRPVKADPPRAVATQVREKRAPDERGGIVAPAVTPGPQPNGGHPAASRGAAPARDRPQPAEARPAPQPTAVRRAPSMPSAMTGASGLPVALPADFYEEARRWQRRRRIGMAVAAASFLAVIALSALRSRMSRGGPPPSGAIVQPAAASEAPVGPATVAITLTSAVDSLSGALAYYRDIANDHRQGLVGCRVLERAYALVGRAQTRVDSARRQIPGGLSDADSIRVSMIGAEYTHVAQTYRRSGCHS